jgi:hypothetical protein
MRLAACVIGFVFLGLATPAAAVSLIGSNPAGPSDSNVLAIETDPFSFQQIGLAGTPSLSGLDVQPGTGALFGSGGFGASGALFHVNPSTGGATKVGDTGFLAVPGLAFDLDGTLYGTASDNVLDFSNLLIRIDPTSGAGTLVGSLGTVGPDSVAGVDGIAVNPMTGVLYGVGGVVNAAGNFLGGGMVYTIDKQSGAATMIGQLPPPATNVAGLAFDPTGRLFGSLGLRDGRLVQINLSDFSVQVLGDTGGGSLSDIAVVPEPATTAVVGLASLAVLALARRRWPR